MSLLLTIALVLRNTLPMPMQKQSVEPKQILYSFATWLISEMRRPDIIACRCVWTISMLIMAKEWRGLVPIAPQVFSVKK